MKLPEGTVGTAQAPELSDSHSNPVGMLQNISGSVPQSSLSCLSASATAAPSQPAAGRERVLYGNGAVLLQAALPDIVKGQHPLPVHGMDLSEQLSQLRLQQQQPPQQQPQGEASLQQPQQQSEAVEQDARDPSDARDPAAGQSQSYQEESSRAGSRSCASSGDVRVLDGPAEWVWFGGEWGTTLAPISQGWFHTAETPVSRSAWLRVLVQAWPETQRI